jgi:transposase
MFIRVKTTPNSPKRSVQIVKSERIGGKVSQKIVRHIGTGLDDIEIKKLVELAEYLKCKLEEESTPTLFTAETLSEMAIESRNRKTENEKKLNVNLKNLREESRVVIGVHEVYGEIYKELGFDSVIKEPKRNVAVNKNLFNIVMARLANPTSKRASVIELERDFGIRLSLDGVYKMMDKIDDTVINKIQRNSYQAAQEILKEKINVVFYDCTTLYFESFTEDELKQNGYSKDLKFNQPQVLLGLLSTSEGFPIGYEVYEGSKYEGHTVEDAITKIKDKYEVDKVVFVADSGMLNRNNTEFLEDKEQDYILGARLKNMDKKVTKEILNKENYKVTSEGEKTAVIQLSEKKRLIVTYNANRARKDKYDREKAIEKLRVKFTKAKKTESLISNHGYKKYLKITGNSKVELEETKIEEAYKWDGLKGLITNQMELSPREIRDYYSLLWQIEENFRISKHDLRIRPIYHWTPKRIKAHIAICYMALVCARHLEYRVKIQYEKLSPEVIRNELVHTQASILMDIETKKKYCIPSLITKHTKKIYQTVGKKIGCVPFEIIAKTKL